MGIVLVLLGLSLLVTVHELGHFLAAKYYGMGVIEFAVGFPPRIFQKKIGRTVYSIGLIFLGGFVKIFGENGDAVVVNSEKSEEVNKEIIFTKEESFAAARTGAKAVVLAMGVIMNFLFGWLLFALVFMIGTTPRIMIEQVFAESPAMKAGLMPGDEVTGFASLEVFINYIKAHQGEAVNLTVKRGKGTVQVTPVLEANPVKGKGALGVGLSEFAGVVRQGFFSSLYEGLVMAFKTVLLILLSLGQIFFLSADVLGPVGIVQVGAGTYSSGMVYLLQFLGLLSINLAVLNSLPIPALDGGRLLFLLIEKLSGRNLSEKFQVVANAVSFGLLILLIVFVTVKDILRFL
jgi:regulator of sigma E protease